MDAVRIQIIRGCDAQGQGGTIADDASGVLADGILDQVVAAFEGVFGLYSWANPAFDPEQEESDQNQRNLTVSPLRNVATRLWQRQHGWNAYHILCRTWHRLCDTR